MNEDLPNLAVNQIGRRQNRRFIIVDQFRRVWNGRHFDSVRSKARIYQSRNEATLIAQDFICQHYKKKPKSNFVVPVMIEVLTDEPVPIAELLKWCFRATCLSVETLSRGNGPNGSLVSPKIIWNEIQKQSPIQRSL